MAEAFLRGQDQPVVADCTAGLELIHGAEELTDGQIEQRRDPALISVGGGVAVGRLAGGAGPQRGRKR